MKKLLCLLFLLSLAFPGYSQPASKVVTSGETYTFGGVTMRRTKERYSTTIYNVHNTRGDAPYVLLDGSPAPGFDEDYHMDSFNVAGFDKAMRMVFTAAEQAEYGRAGEKVIIYLVFDNNGKLLEVDFILNSKSRLRDIPLQKFILWHNYIKQYVTATITDPATKQLQFVHGTMFYGFPPR